jgi:hypothetical protein
MEKENHSVCAWQSNCFGCDRSARGCQLWKSRAYGYSRAADGYTIFCRYARAADRYADGGGGSTHGDDCTANEYAASSHGNARKQPAGGF